MKSIHFFNILFLISLFDNISCFFDPMYSEIMEDMASGFHYFKDSIKSNTYCKAFECCNDDYIPARFNALKYELDSKLYGQHIAKQTIVDALKAHFADTSPQKALTLSLHGWPGCGKNYVTNFIKKYMFKEGKNSKFVHHFYSRIHFPLDEKVDEYKHNLQNWLKGNVSACERSLFIFDEVDKMPENILNGIKPMIDYNELVDKVDYRKSVFIFISNTGTTIIKDHFLSLREKAIKREDIDLSHFELIIANGAFNEKGGFHYSDVIKSNLIDHYIPFLPMEKEHVKLCIRDEFRRRNISNPTEEHIEEVMKVVKWGPEPLNLFSTTGCKRLSQKVALVINKIDN